MLQEIVILREENKHLRNKIISLENDIEMEKELAAEIAAGEDW